MWQSGWRDQIWSELDKKWDLVVIGGGITGAGILREAVRLGFRTLLVEAHDFASGTSSRSSKLVHGGLRYLKNGQIRLTVESVHERERLVNERRGLVSPLGFLIANFQRDALPAWLFGLGLVAYDLLALKWTHRRYDAYDMLDLCPPLSSEGLVGGFRYFDAQTDDARLVLRVIQEAIQGGGRAINYAPVIQLLHNQSGQVCGIVLQDDSPEGGGRTAEVQASVVISATGAWADNLRSMVGEKKEGLEPRLRKLRGSHLIFPADRLPLTRAVSFLHPKDGRPVFAIPWEGVTLLGTTDVDHGPNLQVDPAISAGEVEYLLKAAQQIFAAQELTEQDIQGAFSGIRPVINTGKTDPSKESREHVLWNENGLITVAGGKLTTFRLMAQDALRKARQLLPHLPSPRTDERVFSEIPTSIQDLAHLPPELRLRLLGRHGQNAATLVMAARQGELEPVAHTLNLWAELRWAARSEAVQHLDDLLLRRVRLGLLLPQGGLNCMQRIRSIVQPELSWGDHRWEQEAANYTRLWKACYHLK